MFESMFIGISGLSSYSRGLTVISNNLANMNTAGFKGASMNFGDLFYRQSSTGSGGAYSQVQYGTGVHVLSTTTNFRAGELRQTGNALDVAVDGAGYLITREGDSQHFTRDGHLSFDKDGMLVVSTTGRRVAGYAADGSLVDVSINGMRINAPVATTQVVLQGNLSSTETEFSVQQLPVIDALGGTHVLRVTFRNTGVTAAGSWAVSVSDEAGEVGTGNVQFTDGRPDAAASAVTVSYAPPGVAAMNFTITLGDNATSFASGNSSSLSVASHNGLGAGALTSIGVDEAGFLVGTYSNGQTQQGPQLALARVAADTALTPAGNGEFVLADPSGLQLGRAGQDGFGKFSAGHIEGSNVNLATEFTDLIVMQRGYQASSRVVSTANDMIQELFDMKGHR